MKRQTTRQIGILVLIMMVAWLSSHAASKNAKSLPDSLVAEDNVYLYMFSDTEKAEAIMAALREKGDQPAWELDYVEGDLYFNTGRYYKALPFYTAVLGSSKAKSDDELYMDILHRMISCHDATHNVTLRTDYIQRLLKKAQECDDKAMQAVAIFNMGKSLYEQGTRQEGYQQMEKAAKMMDATDYKNKYDNLRYHYGTLLTYYERDERGDDALRILHALAKVVTAATGKENVDIEGLDVKEKKSLYGHSTVIYNMLGRTKEADDCYKKFISLGKITDADNNIVMPYLFDRKNYKEIFRICQQRKRMLEEQGDTVNYRMATVLKNLGGAYYELGSYQLSADYYAQLASLRDSLKTREQNNALTELAELYDSGEKSKTILQQKFEMRILGLIAVAMLLIALAVLRNSRRLRQRNISLVRAVRTGIAQKEKIQKKEEECLVLREKIATLQNKLKTLKQSNNEATPSVQTKEEKENQLLQQAMHDIVDKQLFCQPNFTSKVAHETLGVSSSLFGDFFEKQTGKKFAEYINELRMNYAAKQLIEHSSYTIDAVAKMCGIDSRQHFHRLFSEAFGITPSAFRKGHQGSGGGKNAYSWLSV